MAYQSILNPMPVSIATMPSTPVTGTFWQATQPVSGTVTIGNASLAVTGTFFQATQPVSIATMPSTPVTGTFWQATQPVSLASTTITGNVAITAASLPLPTGAATETTLAALNTKTPGVGQATMANSRPVVIASNQGPLTTATTDTVATGTIAALNATLAVAINGAAGMRTQITGTWVGTLAFEGTVDGTNWVAINAVAAGLSVPAQTATANGVYAPTPAGFAQIRLNATAWTSGTATITHRVSTGTGGTYLNQSLPSFSAIQAFKVDQTTPGTTNLVSLAAPPATYSAAIVGLTVAATATDIFTLTGSATKTVRVSRILVNGVQTTAAQVNVLLIRRSTADTLGTSTAPTAATYDTTNAAATATALAYTANPTLGTTVGTASARRVFIPGAATASDAQGLEIVSGDVGQQLMTLRGIAQVLAVNLGGVTVVGGSLNVTIEWTES